MKTLAVCMEKMGPTVHRMDTFHELVRAHVAWFILD